jgi:Selenoprotein, putative
MRVACSKVERTLALFWQGLRQWCGDAAYENYRKCARRTGQGSILSPSQYYVQQLNKKYSRPNRCC